MFVIISKSHFTLVVLKPNFSFKNGTKNGQIVLSFFIRNSCTRFNLVPTLLPSLQKKWYSAFSLPPPSHRCATLFFPSSTSQSLLRWILPLPTPLSFFLTATAFTFFWRVGGEEDDTSKSISIFAIKMWSRIDILISSALKMNLTLIF